MEINFVPPSVGNLNFGAKVDDRPPQAGDLGATANATRRESLGFKTADFKLSAFDPLQRSEPVADVPESELSRDDALGKLISGAFNLSAPPMPDFSSLPQG